MPNTIWQQCVQCLQDELPSQQFNTWIRPLQVQDDDSSAFCLTAPNRFVKDWVNDKYVQRIRELVVELSGGEWDEVKLAINQQQRTPVVRPSTQNRRAESVSVMQSNRLVQEASLNREVILVGVRNRAEVWDREKWEEFQASFSENFDDVARNALN